MNASRKAALCLSALCCICCGNSGKSATVGNGFASGNLKFSNHDNTVPAQREESPKSDEFFYYYFYKDGKIIGSYSSNDLKCSSKSDEITETAKEADRLAVSTTETLPTVDPEIEGKQAVRLKGALKSARNMATHGKMFWWGYQVYFSHQTMIEIDSAMSTSKPASAGLTAILGAVAAEAGVVDGVLAAFVFTNFAVMKAFDKGEGVTLTQEIRGPGIYWFHSGNCIRGESL